MVDAIGARSFTQRSSIPCDSEVSLPCILGRLTKLEAEGLSYDELLHDFANRRRVAPVEENRPVKNVVDPAQETDEIVQVRSGSSPLEERSTPARSSGCNRIFVMAHIMEFHLVMDAWQTWGTRSLNYRWNHCGNSLASVLRSSYRASREIII